MTIKDPERDASAPELAAARLARLQELLQRFRQIHWPEGVNSKEMQDELYDDQGLPV
jgi:antitoxin VapB